MSLRRTLPWCLELCPWENFSTKSVISAGRILPMPIIMSFRWTLHLQQELCPWEELFTDAWSYVPCKKLFQQPELFPSEELFADAELFTVGFYWLLVLVSFPWVVGRGYRLKSRQFSPDPLDLLEVLLLLPPWQTGWVWTAVVVWEQGFVHHWNIQQSFVTFHYDISAI